MFHEFAGLLQIAIPRADIGPPGSNPAQFIPQCAHLQVLT